MWHSRFSRATGKRVLETMLACGASRETFRRAAVCTGQSAEDHIRPANREACRRAAVKRSQVTFSRVALRAIGAQSGVKGGERKRVPSGHNRRRRLATGSRQPKRGFDTAVSKTTIEVAGHYPLVGGFPVFALGDLGDEGDAESDNVLHDLLKKG